TGVQSCALPIFQAADQNIRLTTALGQLLDLRIFRGEFVAKESHLPFQSADVPLGKVGAGRDMSRLVGACRLRLSLGVVSIFSSDMCRVLSRQVPPCRRWLSRDG